MSGESEILRSRWIIWRSCLGFYCCCL